MALKIAPLGRRIGESEKRSLEIIKAVRHPNLLCIFGTWENDNRLVVAMELADRSLAERLDEARAQGLKGIPRDELLEYMSEAAKGLDFLHQRRHVAPDGTLTSIEHRDIKPQNLLLIGGSVKVADFGLVRCLEYSVASHSGLMTVAYAPPEFFKGKTSTQSDQYSLAVTYCVLRTGAIAVRRSPAHVSGGQPATRSRSVCATSGGAPGRRAGSCYGASRPVAELSSVCGWASRGSRQPSQLAKAISVGGSIYCRPPLASSPIR